MSVDSWDSIIESAIKISLVQVFPEWIEPSYVGLTILLWLNKQVTESQTH